MRHSALRITDKNGASFKMKVSTTTAKGRIAAGAGQQLNKRLLRDNDTARDLLAGVLLGEWKTYDQSFIRYHSGQTRSRLTHNGDMTTRDLLILGVDGIKAFDGSEQFGMQLFEYEDVLGVNDEGEGFVIQPWVVSLTLGRIWWKVI